MTAARALRGEPNVVQVMPLARTIRTSSTAVLIDPDEGNRLVAGPQPRASTSDRWPRRAFASEVGNVAPVALDEVRETLALLLELWSREHHRLRGRKKVRLCAAIDLKRRPGVRRQTNVGV